MLNIIIYDLLPNTSHTRLGKENANFHPYVAYEVFHQARMAHVAPGNPTLYHMF